MTDELVSASTPTGIDWGKHLGGLMVIEPFSYEPSINTTNGPKDAVRANVHVLTSPTTSVDYEDSLIFPMVLVGQTRNRIGQKVVGRLGQGEAKGGQNPPWRLNEASDTDMGYARQWLAARQLQPAAAPPQQQAQPHGWQPAAPQHQWPEQPAQPAQDPWATATPTEEPPF